MHSCHETISDVAYLWRSLSTQDQKNNTTRTLKHGGVKQWCSQLRLTSPTLPLFNEHGRTRITREGHEARRTAGVRMWTRQEAARTMGDSGQGGTSRQGQWTMVAKVSRDASQSQVYRGMATSQPSPQRSLIVIYLAIVTTQ
jgi:hypothetical protein